MSNISILDESIKIKIFDKINMLKIFLNNNIIDCKNVTAKECYNYMNKIKSIIENYNTDISFISCLMAKEYLIDKYEIENFDIGSKSQTAPGLDIDLMTKDGIHIIAEIKATMSIRNSNLGSQQRDKICEDLRKLNEQNADKKYFFVTEQNTYNIIIKKLKRELNDIEIVLLN